MSLNFLAAPPPLAENAILARRTALAAALVLPPLAALAILATPAVSDPGLARLLQGMAALKGVLTLAIAAAAFWRLGRPAPFLTAAGYVAGVAIMAGCVGLVWRLTALGPVSFVFHGAMIALAVLALRDGMER